MRLEFLPDSQIRPTGAPVAPGQAAQVASDLDRSRWSSDQLLAGCKEAEIVHGDTVYRLRLTSLGKLILTK